MSSQQNGPGTDRSGSSAEAGTEEKPGYDGSAFAEHVARSRRARLVGGLCLFFVMAGAGWFGYWHFFARNVESTDDAYVAGNLVRVSPEVSGTVREILTDNTQAVSSGQVLVRLDSADAHIVLERARASLADAVRQTRSLMIEAQRLTAVIALRKAELGKAEGDYDRRKNRKTSLSVSAEELSHSRDNVILAETALRIARHSWEGTRMLIQNTPVHDQPLVQLRAHQVREAWLAFKRCEIKSSVNGYVARRTVQVGTHVAPGAALMAVVPLEDVWVDANFKEVQLGRIRIGQPVSIQADLYGASVTYQGTVVGFSAGTGSSFSLLPPENATGNWIKVVQRVPVKIRLKKEEVQKAPLLVGLSCTVHVDVSNTDGAMLAPTQGEGQVLSTTALEHDLTEINAEIESIIATNTFNE